MKKSGSGMAKAEWNVVGVHVETSLRLGSCICSTCCNCRRCCRSHRICEEHDEDRHEAPASTSPCPLSLQEAGALPFPDLIGNIHQDELPFPDLIGNIHQDEATPHSRSCLSLFIIGAGPDLPAPQAGRLGPSGVCAALMRYPGSFVKTA